MVARRRERRARHSELWPLTLTQAAPAPLSLDDIFRRTVGAKPAADALFDPADKLRITGHAPQQMTFEQADRAITNLASHFAASGLQTGAVLAVQLPNTIEAILVIMAGIRAGLVVAPIPLLWRQSELNDALNRIRARSLVTMSRINGVDHCDLAMNAAAATFTIRHVGVFGDEVPDGVSPLSDIMRQTTAHQALPPSDPRSACLITFDVTPDGLRVVPRTQLQLIAGGLCVFLDANIAGTPRLMSAVMPSSFAGLCMSLVTWLLCGDSLSLHHPLDPDGLVSQMADDGCSALMAPASLALRLAETGVLSRVPSLERIIGLWRTPEQVVASEDWNGNAAFSDLYAFGEAGLAVINRDGNGGVGRLIETRQPATPAASCQMTVTQGGTLALRGAMVPVSAYAMPATPAETAGRPDSVDTGYAARIDKASGTITITAPPSGLVSVGGYRFLSRELSDWAQRLPQGGMLTALPDRMNGYRLAGRAGDNARARSVFTELGLNPLMVEAFRDRTPVEGS